MIDSPYRTHRRRVRRPPRHGLTLYEVMVSLAILLPALTVLGQAISHGGRAALQAQLHTEAAIRCDSLIAEVLAGVYPMSPVSGSLFDDGDPNWTWSLEVYDGPYEGLLELDVTVTHIGANGTVNATSKLSRLVRDPEMATSAAASTASQSSASGATTSSSQL